MKTLKQCGVGSLLAVLGLTVAVPVQLRAQPPLSPQPPRKVPEAQPDADFAVKPTNQAPAPKPIVLNANVAQAQQELAHMDARYKAGITTLSSVQEAEIKLAEARLRLAVFEKQPQTIIEQAELIVKHHERLVALDTERYKAGIATTVELNAARIELAEARMRLELHSLVALREENLARTTTLYQQGTASREQIENATNALAQAQSRLPAE